MEKDPANSISYYLSIAQVHKNDLGAIRHWENLKIAFEEDLIWVKDFTAGQIEGLEVKSIPYKEVYYSMAGKLFKRGSRLPHRNLPALLWTPIERGLPVRLPAFNHNYFGITNKATIRLVLSDKEQEAFGLLTSLTLLQTYMESAPAIRLQHLQWALINEDKAIILGTPQLPVPGAVFWQQSDFLIPAGYDLEFPVLTDTMQDLLNPEKESWIVWEKEGRYWGIDKEALQPLSISSFRQSIVHE
jgi:hypothetical protein